MLARADRMMAEFIERTIEQGVAVHEAAQRGRSDGERRRYCAINRAHADSGCACCFNQALHNLDTRQEATKGLPEG